MINKKEIFIFAPVTGKIKDIKTVADETFASKMIGDGIAIEPTENDFYAPFDGKLETVFHTGHAYGVTNEDGIQILIHIGINTVELNGEGFKTGVKQDDNIKGGEYLGSADIKLIAKKGKSTDVMIIAVNGSYDGYKLEIIASGNVNAGEAIFKLTKKK